MADENNGSSEKVTIICPHCSNRVETDQLQEVECTACCDNYLSIQVEYCKECNSPYCLGCADDYMNDLGFCEDCAEVECKVCDESMDRGRHRECVGCHSAYCIDHKDSHLDNDGLCVDCTSHKTAGCLVCGEGLIEDKAVLCKNYPLCGSIYCPDGDCRDLNKDGYCNKCMPQNVSSVLSSMSRGFNSGGRKISWRECYECRNNFPKRCRDHRGFLFRLFSS